MITLFESILSSTKTGKTGIVIKWFKENHIMETGIGCFHSKNHRNDYYSSLFLKDGKVCIDDDMEGSINFALPGVPKIPDYIKFGWCPGIDFHLSSEKITSDQIPEVCDTLSFNTPKGKIFSFKSKIASILSINCDKNDKIILTNSEVEVDYKKPSGGENHFYISFNGDLDFNSLKKLIIKDPLKRGVTITVFVKKRYISPTSRVSISKENPEKLKRFIKKFAPGIPTLMQISVQGDDSFGDPEIDKEFLY